jgi:hypothetical protein
MITGFGNNTVSALASDITATQTSLPLMPGAGVIFAKLLTTGLSNPSSPHKIYAKITLTDSLETVFEICHLTAVSQDTLTVIRGQEGTAAKGWALNDVVANFATRGSEQSFVQIEQLQGGDYTSATAGGTPNALTVSLPSTFFNNNLNDWLLKTPLFVTPIETNSGAATLQLTMGGRVLGTYPLVKGSNTALRAGDIVAKTPFLTAFNAEEERFIVLNPTTDVGSVRTVNSHAPNAAGDVKLGTAADADVQTSEMDNTTGHLIPMGNYGIAPFLPAQTGVDLDTLQTYGIHVVSNVTNGPFDGDIGAMFVYVATWQSGSGTAGYRITQEAIGYGQSASTANRVARRTFDGTVWTAWDEYFTQGYKPTAEDTGALPISGGTVTGDLSVKGKVTLSDKPLEVGSQTIASAASIDFHTDGLPDDYNARITADAGTCNITLVTTDDGSATEGALYHAGAGGRRIIQTISSGVSLASADIAVRLWGNAGDRPCVMEWDVVGGPWLMSIELPPDGSSAKFGVNGAIDAVTITEGGQRVYSPNNPQPGPDLSSYVQGLRKGARVSLGGSQDITTDDGYIDDFHFASQPDDSHIWQSGYSPLQYLVNGTWQTLWFGVFESSLREIKPVPDGINLLLNFDVHRNTLVDENGHEWYAASKKIQGKHFVGYLASGVIVVSDTDASMLFPRGMSVAGVDSLPEGFEPDGENWVFDGTHVVPRTSTTEETAARNRIEQARLCRNAAEAGWPLQSAVVLGVATNAQKAQLLALQQYTVAVMAMDLTQSPVDWPMPPNL